MRSTHFKILVLLLTLTLTTLVLGALIDVVAEPLFPTHPSASVDFWTDGPPPTHPTYLPVRQVDGTTITQKMVAVTGTGPIRTFILPTIPGFPQFCFPPFGSDLPTFTQPTPPSPPAIPIDTQQIGDSDTTLIQTGVSLSDINVQINNDKTTGPFSTLTFTLPTEPPFPPFSFRHHSLLTGAAVPTLTPANHFSLPPITETLWELPLTTIIFEGRNVPGHEFGQSLPTDLANTDLPPTLITRPRPAASAFSGVPVLTPTPTNRFGFPPIRESLPPGFSITVPTSTPRPTGTPTNSFSLPHITETLWDTFRGRDVQGRGIEE